ncbi:MAG: hypothetical protein B7Z21_00290, partial [Verrucomicrobiales bacterium 32-60-5]
MPHISAKAELAPAHRCAKFFLFMRPNRLPVLFFATAVLIMAGSILWLFWVSNAEPSFKAGVTPTKRSLNSGTPPVLTAMPQIPAVASTNPTALP